MPKFFDGSKPLPENLIKIQSEELTSEKLEEHVALEGQDYAISVVLPGLPETSLGYIFFVMKHQYGYQLKNITDVVFFRSLPLGELVTIMKHAAGIEYNSDIQQEFTRIRTEIGIDQ